MLRKKSTDRNPSGLTLIEVLVSTLIVGLVLVTAMKMVGASVQSGQDTSQRTKAVLLAEDLMNEILKQKYEEPDGTPAFGIEAGEGSATTGPRITWDDVDDYKSWDASPPKEKDGTQREDLVGWRRWVEVKHVDPGDLSAALADTDDQGVKRVTVHVSHNGDTLASLASIQTRAWIDTIPEPGNHQTTGAKPPGNQGPTALAAANDTSGWSPLEVNFDATESSDPEGNPLNYHWDFGDGDTATGAKPTHTFIYNGPSFTFRTVTLTVTDVYGASSTDTLTITILN